MNFSEGRQGGAAAPPAPPKSATDVDVLCPETMSPSGLMTRFKWQASVYKNNTSQNLWFSQSTGVTRSAVYQHSKRWQKYERNEWIKNIPNRIVPTNRVFSESRGKLVCPVSLAIIFYPPRLCPCYPSIVSDVGLRLKFKTLVSAKDKPPSAYLTRQNPSKISSTGRLGRGFGRPKYISTFLVWFGPNE